MYKVRCGIKMDYWDKGMVFGNQTNFVIIEDAKVEVNKMLSEMIEKMFGKSKHNGLSMIDEQFMAWHEDGTQLIGRLDGTIYEGEFYIEIVKE